MRSSRLPVVKTLDEFDFSFQPSISGSAHGEIRLRPSSILSIIIINPGLDSRARTALEHMLESVVSARGKVLRTNFSATSRVTRATKLTQAASRHSYRWCNPPTRGSATTFAVGDGRCVTALKLGVSLFSPKWQRSS